MVAIHGTGTRHPSSQPSSRGLSLSHALIAKATAPMLCAPRCTRHVGPARLACYHLISAANPDDQRISIGARALTGDAYLGHVFWDTEGLSKIKPSQVVYHAAYIYRLEEHLWI